MDFSTSAHCQQGKRTLLFKMCRLQKHEKIYENPSSLRGQAVSENSGIWNLCQQIIDTVESEEHR